MAHGNVSDLVAIILLAGTVQCIFFPSLLSEDAGPFKATFAKSSPELATMIKFSGGFFLIIAMMFSGIKWNPVNGKMGGLGCFLCVANIVNTLFRKQDSGTFVPHLFYVYAVTILLGGIHIFLFPSNPPTPKSPEIKNNHGNMSDMVFFALLAGSIQSIFFPSMLCQDFGPIKAQFATCSAELETMISFAGSLILIVGLTFSGVKWNPINGKMSGLGCFLCVANILHMQFLKLDGGVFVPRPFYLYALLIALGGIHIFLFPANPLSPKAKGN